MGLARAGIAVFLTALALAPAAQAAQRYAAPPPAAGPEPCAQAAPCSLKAAVTKAKTGDEVIVGSGSYAVTEQLYPEGGAANVYVHGDFGGPMPQISGTGTAYTVFLPGGGSRLSYLRMSTTMLGASAVFCYGNGSAVERVVASAQAEYSTGIRVEGNCTVRDSVARVEGTNSTGIGAASFTSTVSAVVRNVTAVATGTNSRGVVAACPACISGSVTIDLRNSIASGTGADLEAVPGLTPGKIFVANSNFDVAKTMGESVFDKGGNQSAAPLFVNAAAGDFREAAGSPTIDAGAVDQLGALDPDGNARVLGTAPDIGAYEFIPPPVAARPLGEIQSLTVAPKAFEPVNAGGAILSARKKKEAPVSTAVTYTVSAAATVEFGVERKLPGRKVGKRCVKQTKANRAKKKCPLFKKVKGSFTHSGLAGSNTFRFSGRLNGKGLKPGSYRLVGRTGSVSKAASFKIVR
jgi:hypothetical protein